MQLPSTNPSSFKLPVAGGSQPTLNALPASHQRLSMVDILLADKPLSCLCNTGAEINLLPAKFVKKHATKVQRQPNRHPVMVDGMGVQCRSMTTATIAIGQQVTPATFYIVEGV